MDIDLGNSLISTCTRTESLGFAANFKRGTCTMLISDVGMCKVAHLISDIIDAGILDCTRLNDSTGAGFGCGACKVGNAGGRAATSRSFAIAVCQ